VETERQNVSLHADATAARRDGTRYDVPRRPSRPMFDRAADVGARAGRMASVARATNVNQRHVTEAGIEVVRVVRAKRGKAYTGR